MCLELVLRHIFYILYFILFLGLSHMLKFILPSSLALTTLCLFLAACQTKVGCTDDQTRCFAQQKNTDASQLNPQFNYIKLVFNGRVFWIAQGAQTAQSSVYYSADGSVLKWSNGRLSAITSPDFKWREANVSHIDWSQFLKSNPAPYYLTRSIDTVDGVLSRQEQRQITRIEMPKHHQYTGDTSHLIWLHETTSNTVNYKTFDTWYALDSRTGVPVYGQSCISTEQCLSWQKWERQ